MVLESVVADLLNRFLGDYVENLNKSQLKLGIWGGNVALDNLQIKENALSELDVPFRVKVGQIDKLTLKIPWKNLYGEAVVATLEGLYLLIVPGASIKYDAEKEEKYLQDNKQKELTRIEEALQKAAEKDKPKEEKKDTFLEKLATQVIKNVQVKITGIHIKYEDDTTNENWKPSILNDATKVIYKDQLKRGIPCGDNQPQDYQYIFRPVSASARVFINPNAEVELKTPKLECNVEVQRIAVELTKPQYLSMIDLLESIDYMVRNAPYRKYRPNVSLHKNARKWWKYAGDSVLEVHIRRHTRMWSWSNIRQHRQLLKTYKNAYKNKLTQSKLSEETQRQIQTIRSGQKLLKKKATEVEKKSGGWFSGFWGRRESRKKEDEESSVPETIDELMTPEEKAKLFTAIGYSDSSYHLSLPKQYIAHIVTLKLVSTSLTIKEDKNVAETLKVQIIDLSTKISQRPGAQAIRVEAKLENWYVTGLRQENIVPSLVASIGDSKSSLLKIEFNTNPEDSTADQSLSIESQPVEIKYDATSKGMDLERLTSATLMKLEEIKERTATGLVHIIEMRKVLDLKIHLKPSYLVVPQTGFYHENSNLLILDFGTFQLNSINQGNSEASSFSSLEEIMDKAYDKFDVEIKNVQLLFGRAGEDWKKARFQRSSTLHMLQPMDIHIQLAKSMVEKDARMAKFKVSGGLPLVHIRVSDQKIKAIFDLIDSIPLPQMSSVSIPSTKAATVPTIPVDAKGLLTTHHLLAEMVSDSEEEYFDFEESCEQGDRTLSKGEEIRNKESAQEELTDLQLKFEIKEVLLELTRQEKTEETILVFDVKHLGTEATVRTYNLAAVSYLKTISLDYYEIGGKKAPLHLISSSDKPGLDLLKVEYIKADKNGPQFQTIFDNTEQKIESNQTEFFARLKDIVVTDVDTRTLHKKAVSIVGDEVFSFSLVLYPYATEGEAYTDMSKVDGTVSLKVGCIQIVYLHKFLVSLLTFLNNFQTAKEALSAATVQAAEKAATSVKDLAQRSFRLAMDIHLKAPVIVIPQSSVSFNAIVVDLGLIKVQNHFSLVSPEGSLLPPVIDKMDVQLTKLKLSRTTVEAGLSHQDIQILQPINLSLSVNRNLAAAWFHKLPVLEITGYLDTMNVVVSQEDLNVFLKVLTENLGEAEEKQTNAKQVLPEEGKKSIEKEDMADADGPDFVTTYSSTKQTINVIFSCLDIVLHTEALISIMSFLTFSVPSGPLSSTDKAPDHKPQTEEKEKGSALRPASGSTSHDDICELKLTANLNAFNISVCDQTCRIADIRIQGMDASVALKTKKVEVFSRLEDIIITNVDPKTIHKKAVSIMGDEVFRFQMSLYPDATAGKAYADMSKVDGKMSLKVGCIQIVYLHQFFMSLLNFLNNFQTAQAALSAVTVQAAEMAASSMKDFAKKSFRLLMDINLKAPVIVVPESSASCNALVADLGLIRVQNEFKFVSSDESSLPPVIDNMDVQLTHLKLSRCILSTDSQPDSEILCPVSLTLLVQRNLAATWYHEAPTIGIKGDLKPMQIALSQDDLTVVMKILLENLGGASSRPNTVQQSVEDNQMVRKEKVPHESDTFEGQDVSTSQSSAECYTMLKFDFNFESLSVTLYNSDMNQKPLLSLHNEKLRLGELRLHLMESSGKIFSDGSVDVNVKLKACTLDDVREGIQNVTARMIDKKDDTNDSSMIDMRYKQDKNGTEVVAILDKLYVCASMEFLLTVADFFINSMPTSSTERSTQRHLKNVTSGKSKPETETPIWPNMKVKAVVMDPEIVFVANLTSADAPALKVSFQCDFSLTSGKLAQRMTAQVKDFKVLACAFLREKQDKSVTKVLQPCSLVMENMMHVSGLQTVVVTIEELTIKISPIILNTVVTIMAALKPKAAEEDFKGGAEVPENLWQVKPIDQCNAWFLGVDVATEATETFKDREHAVKQEKFDIVVKSVQITLECGLGHRTVPLLLVESLFSGVLKNWSSLMEVSADMSLEIHYYNETYAVWEPLIERIEGGKKQWSLKLEMKTNPVQERSLIPGDDFIVFPEPQTAVNISSKDTMNITISKCCLAVFSNLAKAFSEGTASTFDYSFKDTAPFIVKNALGVPLQVFPSSSFRIVNSAEKENVHCVGSGQNMDLEYSVFEAPQHRKLSALYRQESSIFTLNLELEGYKGVVNIPIAKPGRRLYNIESLLDGHSDSIIVQIDATEGNKVITVRSPLQIKNHFSIPFVIYTLTKDSRSLEPIGISKPEEEFHVPLHSYRCHLYVRPTGMLEGQFRESTTNIVWREELHRSNEVKCLLQCPATETNFLPLIVSTTAVPDQLNYISACGEDWDPAYIIHLHPTLTVRNLLPYSLRYLLEGTAEARELLEGSAADVFHSRINGEIMELVLIKYQGKNWNGHLKIHEGMPEFFSVCFTSHSAVAMTVDLYIHTRRIGSRIILSVFSPYWIINKTSRVLQYRAEDIHVKHPADYRDIVLFSFKKKNIFSKNKVGVSIKMSSFNLTRIVTFTPFYTIANKSSLELEVGEISPNGSFPTNKWNYISTSECLPFWPENSSGELCVRVVGFERASKPFLFKVPDNGTLLRLEELTGGLLVDVNVSEHSTLISFSDYHEGAAPALIVNHTSWDSLRYKQSGLQEEMELKPKQVCLFAWTDPTKTRKLAWSYSQSFGEHDLLKDECGQFPYNANTQIHWVSFLDGRQRVLLFTDDVALVSKALQAEELEQPDQEINLSIHSLGLSLVNNENKKEISYIGITSSGVVWEQKRKQKWKPFSQKQINLLEQAYQKYLSKSAFQGPGWHKLDNSTEVDNQLPGSMFPVVFHPVPPPKSIALDSEPKPFIDISIITRFNEYSKVLQFKYFMVLIQEMALKIDQGFLAALSELFTPSTDPEAERQRSKLIQQDVDALNTELMESSLTDLSMLSFFELFHISPIKLHLSLSLASGGEASDKGEEMIAIHSLNLLLKSIGATLTDVDDLIFKLAFFQIKYQFYKRDQLMKRAVRHYSEQFLKQMYVLVLGLDVLGNPFGLIRGLSEGVEAFFYEPFQGAVQGPEEFAEGFVIGVRSLLGHTVGGAAGVVSRITGSVGKGLAAITMDKEYQQKRREEMGRQPKDFGDSLAKGGKGLLRGVVGGVTGIITKPVEGAKKEGAAGFFKGIGKGLVGVVARPTGGIVDMASSTFQGIQRVAESTEEVPNLRPPRLIHEDGIIRPYDRVEAEGYDLFEKLHIRKLEKENYRYHCELPRGRRANLVVTNRRVIYVKEVEILGHLTAEWDYLFEDFTRCPTCEGNILKLTVLDQRMFQRKDSIGHECVKAVQLRDEATARSVCVAIEEALATRKQQKLVKQASLRLKKPQMLS
ncbi:UNVERIFIED_CONTAM: hypothetical protein H355_004134 [Colinus virginianus]|nr:hypothetical protein H355_004134 [Colinus virginianus]